MIKDEIFEVLALVACANFENEVNRPFLLSDDCVENEIKEHYLGYMHYSGYNIKPPIVITGYYIAHGIFYVTNPDFFANFRQSIIERCKEADISEADAVLYPDEAKGFNYFGGIRNCYKNTKYDPYYIDGRRKRSYKNINWLENVKLRRP